MKIICKQENLIAGLFKVSHLTGKNFNLPILNNILIKVDNGNIELAATNLEVGIKTVVRGKIEEEGRITVPAKILTEYVGLINGSENITLETQEDKLKISSQGWQTKIKTNPAEDYPLIPEVENKKDIKIKIHRFKGMLDQVLFAASFDETRPELTGVLVWFKNNELVLTTTDSYRLAEKKTSLEDGPSVEEKIVIPIRTMQELARILSDEDSEMQIFIEENQVKFSFQETSLMSRLIESEYPDYKQIVPVNFTTDVEFNTNEVIKAVRASSLFAKTGIFDITLSFVKDELTIKSINSQVGENVIKIKTHGGQETPIEVVFNYKYLLDGLNNIGSEKTKIHINSSNTPVVFKPSNNEKYTYLIMPIKQ
ncbi:MAG: DNA polymerase III subunit beta [Patescibacteria group bacterium]